MHVDQSPNYFSSSLVVAGYRLPQCQHGVLDVMETEHTAMRCEGLTDQQNMYWAISTTDGQSSRIAECNICNSSPSCVCTNLKDNFAATRKATNSDLTIISNVRETAGKTIICSQINNVRKDQCQIRVLRKYHFL